MSLTFRCVECGESYEVDDELSGKTIRCRECRGFGRAPFKAAVQKEPPVPMPSLRLGAGPRLQRLTFRHGVLLGIVLTLAGSGLGLWLGLRQHNDAASEHASLPSSPPRIPPVQSAIQPQIIPAAQPAQLAPNRLDVEETQRVEWERQQREAEAAEQRRNEAIERGRQAQLEAAQEAERQRIIEDASAKIAYMQKMNRIEQVRADNIAGRINRNEDLLPGDKRFVIRHWLLFDSPERYPFIVRMAEKDGFKEFCRNLRLKTGDNYQKLAMRYYLLDISGPQDGSSVALELSRIYKQKKRITLPNTVEGNRVRRFIFDNSDLLAPLVPSVK